MIDLLLEIPEYRASAGLGVKPVVVAGAGKNRAGRVLVDMTGGTEGSKEVFEKLARTEVGTVVWMHLSEEHIKEAEKHHIDAVIAGHIASDNLGINLLLDAVEKHGPLEIVGTSGFKRCASLSQDRVGRGRRRAARWPCWTACALAAVLRGTVLRPAHLRSLRRAGGLALRRRRRRRAASRSRRRSTGHWSEANTP